MTIRKGISDYRVSSGLISLFFCIIILLYMLPFIHILAISLSSEGPADANQVGLWPVGLNTKAYLEVLKGGKLLVSLKVSAERLLLGVVINVGLAILTAYPLSHEKDKFPLRNFYAWFIVFTMMFNGGLIPNYVLINRLHLMDNILALIVLPSVVPAFFVIVLMNFFKQIPKEIYESAVIDGATHFKVLRKIYIPLSGAAIATLALLSMVNHWNSWFDGLIYMKTTSNYPIQTYIQVMITRTSAPVSLDDAKSFAQSSRRSILCANLIIAIIPILLTYPHLQKYYKKGMVLGSIKA